MIYKGFKIEKKQHIILPGKFYSFKYGRGGNKTTAFCDSMKEAKAFIDWIVLSDYATINNTATQGAYWKYLDMVK